MYSSDLKLRIDATKRSTYADVVVICGPEQYSEIDPNAVTNPTIIVEVLSPSTEAADRGEKWRHYQRLASLREYVLVSPDEPYVEVFRREGDEWILRTSVAGGVVELPSRGISIGERSPSTRPRLNHEHEPARVHEHEEPSRDPKSKTAETPQGPRPHTRAAGAQPSGVCACLK